MSRITRAGLALGVVLTGVLSAFASSPAVSQASCDATAGDTSKIEGAVTNPGAGYVEDDKTSVRIEGSGFRYADRQALVNPDVSDIRRIEGQLIACDAQALPAGSGRAENYTGDDGGGRSFVWDTPNLDWNGRYAVRLTITAANNTSRTIVQPFRMDLPAAAPTGVKAVADSAGGVAVSWDQNPEPDLVGYLVEWTTAADDDFSERQSAEVLPASESAEPPTTFSHKPGVGEWRYRVIALRPGTQQQGFNASAPSSAATTSVAAPPTTTAGSGSSTGSGTGAGGSTGTTGGAGSGATPTTARSGGTARSAGTVDLSNFSRLLDQRRTATTTPRRPAEPDTGFDETLPFQERPADEPAVEAAAETSPQEQEFAQEIISDDSQRRQAMTFVAASLLFGVLAYGLRLVKREAERIDLEPTEPGTDPHRAEVLEGPAPAVDSRPHGATSSAPGDVATALPDVTSEVPPPLDETPFATDDGLATVAGPATMPVPRPTAATAAPHLDVPLPPRRARRPRPDRVGTGNAGRATRRVPSGPRADRGAGGEAVRPRRRRARSSDRRAPVG